MLSARQNYGDKDFDSHLTPAGTMYHLSLTIIRDYLEEMVINKLKLRSSLTYACLSLALILIAASSLASPAGTETQYRQYLEAAEKVQNFTGVAMVAREGNIIWAQGVGRADFESDRVNFVDTKLAIGSVTKQFTAAAIMRLHEDGKLGLDDPISKYFPDYPEEAANKVTIRHLLTHTSGVVNFTNLPVYLQWKEKDIPLDVQINAISTLPLEFEPGTKFSYSNSGYKLLEAIINQVSGKPWHVYVAENILAPAGMSNSGYDLMTVDEKDRALGYLFDDNGKPKRTELPVASTPGGAGALYSTVGDLAKWDEALRGEKFLKRASLEAMFTPFVDHYGFGFMIDSVAGYQRIWHDGMVDGFRSMFIRIPHEKLCIAVLANNHTLDASRVANHLMAIALGLPYDVPVNKTPAPVDTASYQDYVGAYDLGNGQYRMITSENGKLYSQRSGGTQSQIYPESADKFYYEQNHATTVTFVRDDAGKVVAHSIHQEGTDLRHEKMTAEQTAAILAKTAAIKVDPAIFDRYVGEYQLSPVFSVTIERKEDRIFAQATGQQQFEIFPKSETRYFLKVVDADIEFVMGADGKAESLILFQAGMEQKAIKK